MVQRMFGSSHSKRGRFVEIVAFEGGFIGSGGKGLLQFSMLIFQHPEVLKLSDTKSMELELLNLLGQQLNNIFQMEIFQLQQVGHSPHLFLGRVITFK